MFANNDSDGVDDDDNNNDYRIVRDLDVHATDVQTEPVQI